MIKLLQSICHLLEEGEDLVLATIIDHSGSTVVCVHPDYLEAVDGIRDQIPNVEHFVALEGSGEGWLENAPATPCMSAESRSLAACP